MNEQNDMTDLLRQVQGHATEESIPHLLRHLIRTADDAKNVLESILTYVSLAGSDLLDNDYLSPFWRALLAVPDYFTQLPLPQIGDADFVEESFIELNNKLRDRQEEPGIKCACMLLGALECAWQSEWLTRRLPPVNVPRPPTRIMDFEVPKSE